jgi:hypothetical protein
MPGIITDEMLAIFATIAPPGNLPAALKDRYAGVADRLSLYKPFDPAEVPVFWESFLNAWS